MGLQTTLKAGVEYTLNGALDFGSAVAKYAGPTDVTLGSGTTAQNADLLHIDRITIAASGNATKDLAGSLLDPLGNACVFAKVKAIIVKASAANTNNVVVGAGTNPFNGPLGGTTPTVSVPPGGQFLVSAPKDGWPVTADTADILKFANSNSGSGVDFDLIIIGTSA
jgi:hypothetical protein